MSLLSGCSLPYLVRQGAGQVNLLASARPSREAVRDPQSSAETLDGLAEASRVLAFARTLGLEVGDAYQNYVDLSDRALIHVLTAAPPDRLVSFTWSFPLVGEVSYKGYFDLDAAEREARVLREFGLETRVAPVRAYSSIGWFADPLLSTFFQDGPADLAELLFHELTHRTVFHPGDMRFNENLANFVGQVCAERYLGETRGAESDELVEYLARRRDEAIFRRMTEELKTALARAFEAAATREERLRERERLFAETNAALAATKFESIAFRPYKRGVPWSMPLILSLDLYSGESPLFESVLARCGGDIARFLGVVRALPSEGDAVAGLRSWLERPTQPSPQPPEVGAAGGAPRAGREGSP